MVISRREFKSPRFLRAFEELAHEGSCPLLTGLDAKRRVRSESILAVEQLAADGRRADVNRVRVSIDLGGMIETEVNVTGRRTPAVGDELRDSTVLLVSDLHDAASRSVEFAAAFYTRHDPTRVLQTFCADACIVSIGCRQFSRTSEPNALAAINMFPSVHPVFANLTPWVIQRAQLEDAKYETERIIALFEQVATS